MKKITILWWTSGFWLWLLKYLTSHFKNLDIIITWTDKIKGEIISKKYNVRFLVDNINAVRNREVIIYSLPISLTEQIIKETWKFIDKKSIVLDVTSIKKISVSAFKKYLSKEILVIPTHPMFWPYIESLSGQVIALTPVSSVKENIFYKKFKKYLHKSWMNIIESSANKHDKNMAIVQWLTHFNMFITWKTIEKLWVNIKWTLDFVSPIYKILISCVSRYLHQNPSLYWDIQKYNDQVKNVDNTFKSASKEYYKLIKSDNKSDFIKHVNSSQKYFWNNTEKWQIYTDKIIYLASQQIDKIKNNIGKTVKIINIYSWNIIEWNVDNYKNEKIIMNEKKYDINKWVLV